MTRITIDNTVRSLLDKVTEPVELCDESGKYFGKFVPTIEKQLEGYEMLGPEITKEELQRRMSSNERRYTTAEVIAHLEKLDVQS